MPETGTRRETSRSGSWLHQRRLKIALGIAVAEGILVAVAKGWSIWTIIIISAPIIAFYLFAGRTIESHVGRELAWIAAAAQSFAVVLCVVTKVIGALSLIVAGIFAAIALILLFGERDRPKRT